MHRAQKMKRELPDDTCQPITLKVVTERESTADDSAALAAEAPENQPANSLRLQQQQPRSFLQAAGMKSYADHAGDQANYPLFSRVLFECFAYEVCFGLDVCLDLFRVSLISISLPRSPLADSVRQHQRPSFGAHRRNSDVAACERHHH